MTKNAEPETTELRYFVSDEVEHSCCADATVRDRQNTHGSGSYDKYPTDRFAVWQWFEDDWHECVGQDLGAEDAVKLAHSYTVRPAAQLGIIRKVSIVALDDDSTAFLWEFGKGMVFPTREECANVRD